MTRSFITRNKFYDIRRLVKKMDKLWIDYPNKNAAIEFEVSESTVARVMKARNFKEYKASGNVYGKGVKVLRKRYLFLLIVVLIVLVIINQLIK